MQSTSEHLNTTRSDGEQNNLFMTSVLKKALNVNPKTGKNSENAKIGADSRERYAFSIGGEDVAVDVEQTKNLVAIHNLTEQYLLDTLKLGGFPMPSIAVVKADMGHSDYGDIGVLQ